MLSLTSGLSASQQEIEELQRVFLLLDKDNSGTLNVDELQNITQTEFGKQFIGMTKNDWEEVIKSCDMNGNGVIDFQEFISACLNRKVLVDQNDVRKAFQIIDANKDGKVTKQDFEQLFNSHKKYGGRNMDCKLWEELLMEADKDGDGVITFDDF